MPRPATRDNRVTRDRARATTTRRPTRASESESETETERRRVVVLVLASASWRGAWAPGCQQRTRDPHIWAAGRGNWAVGEYPAYENEKTRSRMGLGCVNF